MGQTCCKPYKGSRCSRLSKIKADAAAAAAAARDSEQTQQPPDPSVVQLLGNNNRSSSAVPGSEPISEPLSMPQIDAAGEVRITIENNDPDNTSSHKKKSRKSRHRKSSREWLQLQRKRLTKPRSKTKVVLAHDEVHGSNGEHPIMLVEASTVSHEASTSYNDSHEPLLVGDDRYSLSPDASGTRRASYQQGPPLLSPTPCRPMGTHFPFLGPATASIAATDSSNDDRASKVEEAPNAKETSRGDNGGSAAASSSVTPATIIAFRRRARHDDEHRDNYGSVSSNSPSIYFLAPSSPQSAAAKKRPVSSILSEARLSVPAASVRGSEAQHSDVEEDILDDIDVDGIMLEHFELEEEELEDTAEQTEEAQDDETQGISAENNAVEEEPVQPDAELDTDFISAVMAFVASQGPRLPTSLARDEVRPEVLVESGRMA